MEVKSPLQAVQSSTRRSFGSMPSSGMLPVVKNVASLKEIVIVLFSSTLVPSALIMLLSSLVRTSSLKIMVMIIPNIKNVGQVGSLYLRSVGFNAKVGSFSDFPTDTSTSCTGGDRCGRVSRSGTFHIVDTADAYVQRATTAFEPSTRVYKMEMKCFQISFMKVY